jgi:tRNA/rRNA methyltransferase
MIQPAFILVAPQMGENIGAAARAMWNFGLDRLRVVAPRDGWPNPKAVAMASGAGRLLDHAGPYATTRDALADCQVVFATTARPRDLTKPVLTPEAAIAQARTLAAQGVQVGWLFGAERTGLENDDIALATSIVSVPVNPAFPSLNLAQAVLLMGYEWARQEGLPLTAEGGAAATLATAEEVARLGDHLETDLDRAGFFFPQDKGPRMKLGLRNMLARWGLTRAEVQTLHGVLRQLDWRGRSRSDGGGA